MRPDFAASTALLNYIPKDLGGNVATLFDCLFQDPTGETDAAGMIAATRELVQVLAEAGHRNAAERVRVAAKAAFDRARNLGARLEEEVAAGHHGGARGAGILENGGAGSGSAAPAEAGDASGMEWLLPEEWVDRDFVLDKGSPLAIQLEQARSWIMNGARYRLLQLDCPNGILLTGPAGTGKTTAAHWLAAKTGRPLAIARHDALTSRYVGQNLKNLRAMIAAAVERGALLLFDEVDAIARDRKLAGIGENHRVEMIESFMEQMTILRKRHPEQVILAATNLPEVLDPSFVRRVAITIEFDFLSRAAREELLAGLYALVDVEDAARDLMLTRSEGRSGDYLRSVAMTAARAAVDDLAAEALAVIDERSAAEHARAEAERASTDVGRRFTINGTGSWAAAEEPAAPPPVLPQEAPALPRPLVTRAHVTTALEVVRDQAAAREKAKGGVVLLGR